MCLIRPIQSLSTTILFSPIVLMRDYLSLLNEQPGRLTPIVYTLSVSDQAKTEEVEHGVKYPLSLTAGDIPDRPVKPVFVTTVSKCIENDCTFFKVIFFEQICRFT